MKRPPRWDMRQHIPDFLDEFKKAAEYREGGLPDNIETSSEYQYFLAGALAMLEEERGKDYLAPWNSLSNLHRTEVLERLSEAVKTKKEADKRNYHKTYWGKSAENEIKRLKVFLELLDAGANITSEGNGSVLIQEGEDTFKFYLLSGKWQVKNSRSFGKVYRSKSPSDFMERYVLKERGRVKESS